MSTTPTLQQLQRGLQLSQMITALEAEMAALFNGLTPASTSSKSDARTGKRSAATIAKMRASQQARWAKVNGTKVEAPAAKAQVERKKGKMSAEGRARIVAAQKARWAKINGEKSGSETAKSTKAPTKNKPWYAS